MKIRLDENEKIREMVCGLYQFDKTELFTQTALAVTDNELLFYDDNAPDEKQSIHFIYHIKKRLSLDNVLLVLDEKIKRNKYLKNMGRLNFLLGSEEDNEAEELFFYYYLEDRRIVDNFISELEALKIKVKKRKVDISYSKI